VWGHGAPFDHELLVGNVHDHAFSVGSAPYAEYALTASPEKMIDDRVCQLVGRLVRIESHRARRRAR